MKRTPPARRLHPREALVTKAEAALRVAITETLARFDLTFGEAVQVLTAAFSTALSNVARYAIREERHGNQRKPGGFA